MAREGTTTVFSTRLTTPSRDSYVPQLGGAFPVVMTSDIHSAITKGVGKVADMRQSMVNNDEAVRVYI